MFNNSSLAFDLTGWRVIGIDFTFKTGDVAITNHQYMVIAKNRAAYTTAFPGAATAAGRFKGDLDAGGQTIHADDRHSSIPQRNDDFHRSTSRWTR